MRLRVRGRSSGWWVTFGAIAFGSLFLVIGLIMAGVSVSFVAGAERARGRVVSLEWSSGDTGGGYRTSRSSNGPTAHPVVEFTPAGGGLTTFHSSTGSNPPAYDVGEEVEVLYRADDPHDAQINGFVSLWLLPLIFTGIGLVIGGIGTAVALASRRRGRRAPAAPVRLDKAPVPG
ncbi:DUF3592 domain-containing protein [Streptomyces sp. VRA16 Mangrove soil]|uniref:DUF3592 domain-containing protein n=1 Tax=Streptomyces sp. VRA16 Mangrove soil TaxID=2817434 RepID=UPI001A9CDFDD|nr:DUF3592 domain-containing protein [Streptomyces sp. VRA16 Mangrove soil]MBO1331711.1 DUF3592 domain-containing protein [Streptomyces sp. VRA16 Mangrove soil]